jgi:Flp pilus assembly protein TadG
MLKEIQRETKTRRSNRQRGQNLVELGLVVPVLVLMLVGLVEFGRFFGMRSTIADAARVGARTAVLPGTHSLSEIQDIVRDELTGRGLNASQAYITASGLNAPTGSQTTVTVQYPFNSIILSMIGRSGSVTLRSVTTMIHE